MSSTQKQQEHVGIFATLWVILAAAFAVLAGVLTTGA